MENRSFSLAILFLALALIPLPASTAEQGVTDERQADWDRRQAQALDLQREGGVRQAEAEKAFAQAEIECPKKFLVNSCRIDAKKVYNQSHNEAKRLENEGKAIERQIKKEQLSDRDQRRAAEMPQHDADLQVREAQTEAARKEAMELQAAKEADKARKAEEGAKRKAADAERLATKQAQHEAKLAAGKEEAARRAAEAAAKSAK
jgi:colicin import membrane protein